VPGAFEVTLYLQHYHLWPCLFIVIAPGVRKWFSVACCYLSLDLLNGKIALASLDFLVYSDSQFLPASLAFLLTVVNTVCKVAVLLFKLVSHPNPLNSLSALNLVLQFLVAQFTLTSSEFPNLWHQSHFSTLIAYCRQLSSSKRSSHLVLCLRCGF
jgi:hypothetical protein